LRYLVWIRKVSKNCVMFQMQIRVSDILGEVTTRHETMETRVEMIKTRLDSLEERISNLPDALAEVIRTQLHRFVSRSGGLAESGSLARSDDKRYSKQHDHLRRRRAKRQAESCVAGPSSALKSSEKCSQFASEDEQTACESSSSDDIFKHLGFSEGGGSAT